MLRSVRSDSRSFPILVLLVAIFMVVALLAAQAYAAATSQRAMAEKVLRDYAAQAADEYARRATNEIGFNGYYFVITALKDAVISPSMTLPTPRDLAPHVPEEGRGALALAKTVFRFDPAAGHLDSAGSRLDPDAADWLRRALEERGLLPLQQGRRYETRYTLVGGTLHGFVFVPVAAVPSGPT